MQHQSGDVVQFSSNVDGGVKESSSALGERRLQEKRLDNTALEPRHHRRRGCCARADSWKDDIIENNNNCRLDIKELNAFLVCGLCMGYLINATSITHCLHSFCHSCILRHLKTENVCPKCLSNNSSLPTKTTPLTTLKHLRFDRQLQMLVYKLVPGLHANELNRRREFRATSGVPECLKSHTGGLNHDGEEVVCRANSTDLLRTAIYSGHESISVCLLTTDLLDANETVDEILKAKCSLSEKEVVTQAESRHILCPVQFTVGHVMKFIKLKHDLSNNYQIEILHSGQVLAETWMLSDVAYIFHEKKVSRLTLHYRICEPLPHSTTVLLSADTSKETPINKTPKFTCTSSSLDEQATTISETESVHPTDTMKRAALNKTLRKKRSSELESLGIVKRFRPSNLETINSERQKRLLKRSHRSGFSFPLGNRSFNPKKNVSKKRKSKQVISKSNTIVNELICHERESSKSATVDCDVMETNDLWEVPVEHSQNSCAQVISSELTTVAVDIIEAVPLIPEQEASLEEYPQPPSTAIDNGYLSESEAELDCELRKIVANVTRRTSMQIDDNAGDQSTVDETSLPDENIEDEFIIDDMSSRSPDTAEQDVEKTTALENEASSNADTECMIVSSLNELASNKFDNYFVNCKSKSSSGCFEDKETPCDEILLLQNGDQIDALDFRETALLAECAVTEKEANNENDQSKERDSASSNNIAPDISESECVTGNNIDIGLSHFRTNCTDQHSETTEITKSQTLKRNNNYINADASTPKIPRPEKPNKECYQNMALIEKCNQSKNAMKASRNYTENHLKSSISESLKVRATRKSSIKLSRVEKPAKKCVISKAPRKTINTKATSTNGCRRSCPAKIKLDARASRPLSRTVSNFSTDGDSCSSVSTQTNPDLMHRYFRRKSKPVGKLMPVKDAPKERYVTLKAKNAGRWSYLRSIQMSSGESKYSFTKNHSPSKKEPCVPVKGLSGNNINPMATSVSVNGTRAYLITLPVSQALSDNIRPCVTILTSRLNVLPVSNSIQALRPVAWQAGTSGGQAVVVNQGGILTPVRIILSQRTPACSEKKEGQGGISETRLPTSNIVGECKTAKVNADKIYTPSLTSSNESFMSPSCSLPSPTFMLEGRQFVQNHFSSSFEANRSSGSTCNGEGTANNTHTKFAQVPVRPVLPYKNIGCSQPGESNRLSQAPNFTFPVPSNLANIASTAAPVTQSPILSMSAIDLALLVARSSASKDNFNPRVSSTVLRDQIMNPVVSVPMPRITPINGSFTSSMSSVCSPNRTTQQFSVTNSLQDSSHDSLKRAIFNFTPDSACPPVGLVDRVASTYQQNCHSSPTQSKPSDLQNEKVTYAPASLIRAIFDQNLISSSANHNATTLCDLTMSHNELCEAHHSDDATSSNLVSPVPVLNRQQNTVLQETAFFNRPSNHSKHQNNGSYDNATIFESSNSNNANTAIRKLDQTIVPEVGEKPMKKVRVSATNPVRKRKCQNSTHAKCDDLSASAVNQTEECPKNQQEAASQESFPSKNLKLKSSLSYTHTSLASSDTERVSVDMLDPEALNSPRCVSSSDTATDYDSVQNHLQGCSQEIRSPETVVESQLGINCQDPAVAELPKWKPLVRNSAVALPKKMYTLLGTSQSHNFFGTSTNDNTANNLPTNSLNNTHQTYEISSTRVSTAGYLNPTVLFDEPSDPSVEHSPPIKQLRLMCRCMPYVHDSIEAQSKNKISEPRCRSASSKDEGKKKIVRTRNWNSADERICNAKRTENSKRKKTLDEGFKNKILNAVNKPKCRI